jgi:hypothetical protein
MHMSESSFPNKMHTRLFVTDRLDPRAQVARSFKFNHSSQCKTDLAAAKRTLQCPFVHVSVTAPGLIRYGFCEGPNANLNKARSGPSQDCRYKSDRAKALAAMRELSKILS